MIELRVRSALSAWQFWMGVAYFGLVAVVVSLFFVASRTIHTSNEIAREQAIRNGQVRATANATYNACAQSIPELERIGVHLRGVNQLGEVILANAKATLDATPHSDPSYALRFENYSRILDAVKRISAVQAFPIPKLEDCVARRQQVLLTGGVTTG